MDALAARQVRTARARWISVIQQHARPASAGRLRILGDPSWEETCIEVVLLAPDGGHSPAEVSGLEVRIDSEQHLIVCEPDRVTYVPWEAIQRISFRRVPPRG
jgi:hypothetical protein